MIRLASRANRFRVVVLTVAIVALGCAAAGPLVAGNWRCHNTIHSTNDAVEIKADGTITVTKQDGQSATGTWTLAGSTLTIHGLVPGGTEYFSIAGDLMTDQFGEVCTRVT